MNKNNFILKSLVASVVTLIAVVGIIYLFAWNNDNKLQGKLVFSKTYNVANSVDKIELVSSEDKVTLVFKDNYWLIENKNNYYADFLLVNNFLNSLNKSIYSIKFPFDKEIADKKLLNNPDEHEENSGILIKTFIKDKIIDEVIVGLADDSKNYYFSRNLNDDNIWLISEDFNLPIYSKDWMVRPVLNIPSKQIEIVKIDGKEVKRMGEYIPFYNDKGIVANVDVLMNVLSGLFVVEAYNNEQFDKIKSADLKTKNIQITLFPGLVFDIDLFYSNDKKVWCKIKLSTTTLPMTIVNDYIKDNKFLYDGWIFEISSEQGHILRDFHLM